MIIPDNLVKMLGNLDMRVMYIASEEEGIRKIEEMKEKGFLLYEITNVDLTDCLCLKFLPQAAFIHSEEWPMYNVTYKYNWEEKKPSKSDTMEIEE